MFRDKDIDIHCTVLNFVSKHCIAMYNKRPVEQISKFQIISTIHKADQCTENVNKHSRKKFALRTKIKEVPLFLLQTNSFITLKTWLGDKRCTRNSITIIETNTPKVSLGKK